MRRSLPLVSRLPWRISAAAFLLALLGGGTIGGGVVAAQSPGAFGPAGQMTSPRSMHTATLLSNGRVLIAGGASGDSLASAEIYDPESGSFRAVGFMRAARRMHTATLLPDDRVLIVGGYDGGTALATAEIFDPATETFGAAGSLNAARGGHTAIVLPTGMVLVIGGYNTRAYPNAAPVELYDPASGTFKPSGAAYVGRGGCDFCAPSVLLHDGTVLYPGQSPAQLYDPASDSFSPSGTMTSELSAAAVLRSGQVLFAGGSPIGRVAIAELYNPATRSFRRTADMAASRVWHTLSPLPDGTVLAAGGETDSCSGNRCTFAGSVASAELYDPSSGTFAATGTMAAARSAHSATLLRDGRLLITGGVYYGGIGIFGGSLDTAEIYAPARLVPVPTLVSDSNDRGRGAIYHAGTRHLVTPGDPAGAGEEIDIYCTGLAADTVFAPRVAIGGRLAAVLSVTRASNRDGVNVRVRLPHGIPAGPAVPVRLFEMDRASNAVTIAVR